MYYTLLITYILGGLTFVPLVALGGIAYALYTAIPVGQLQSSEAARPPEEKGPRSNTNATSRTPSLKSWLTVRRTFEASPSSYISIVRTLLDSRSSHPRRAEDAFYTVLKGNVLYLYEDEAMSECTAAIDVGRCDVRVFPDAGLLDGELFAKRNAILVRMKDVTPEEYADAQKDASSSQPHPQQHSPWYVFFRNVTDMEDWYIALLAASLSSSIPPDAFAPYPYTAQQSLISSLDALPDLIPTRWLNALLGRLFLGIKGTRALESWVVGRLMKKLSKVKTPGFLSAVVVRSFDAGDVAPVLSKPMLKELTPEGEASVGVDVSYVAPPGGGMRITVSATATISLPTTPSLSILGFSGSRNRDKDGQKDKEKEKPYEVSLVLAIVVRRVEGNVLFKIKRPPSNRLWYAFTTMPQMEVSVEPVVSDRQIRWGMVLSAIEGKLKEIIQESVVLPYMDDIPFFDTTPYPLRGGIFADAFAAPSFAHPSEGHTVASTATATATTTMATADRDLNLSTAVAEQKDDQEDSKQAHRTRSADVLLDSGEDGGQSQGPPDADVGMPRAETMTLGRKGGSMRKRRTWFGGKKSDEEEDEVKGGDAESTVAEHRRGRSEEATGVKVLITRDEDTGVTDTDGNQGRDERPVLPQPRAQGSRSVSDASYTPRRSPSPPSFSTARAGLSTSAPSATSPTSSSSPALTSPPPSATGSSFLSTLKSRGAGMAEKPAVKEAMRKWGVGVNWAAALRKGEGHARDGSGGSLRERQREREREREMEADHEQLWDSGRRSASPLGSYADLRKKVEQRERERMKEVSGDSNAGGSGTLPIDIPGVAREEASFERRPPTLRSETSSTSSIRRVSPPGGTAFLSPSAPKTTTELHTSGRAPSPTPIRSASVTPPRQSTPERRGSENSTGKAASPFTLTADDPPTPTPPMPIRAQPKAAMMTIPGIHAKHKGEVMGFGSAPPQLEPQTSTSTGSGSGSGVEGQQAATGKTIHSVYRLFRGGTNATGGSGEVANGEQGMGMGSTSRNPPPLPPRNQPQVQPQVAVAEPPPPSSRISEDPAGPPSPVHSPASQALKSVVQQDAARQPPPLPKRRSSQQSPAQTPRAASYSSGEVGSMSASPSQSASVASSPATPIAISPVSIDSSSAFSSEPEGIVNSSTTPQIPKRENEKWKPPLPPRRSSNSVTALGLEEG